MPGSTTEFTALAGQQAPTIVADTSAETVFESSTSSTGGDTGARIVLNPTALDRLTPLGRGSCCGTRSPTSPRGHVTVIATPSWLVEGFADYVGNLGTGQPVPTAAAELARRGARAASLPAALPTEADFASTSPAGRRCTRRPGWPAG